MLAEHEVPGSNPGSREVVLGLFCYDNSQSQPGICETMMESIVRKIIRKKYFRRHVKPRQEPTGGSNSNNGL